jgi:hypothetical protein
MTQSKLSQVKELLQQFVDYSHRATGKKAPRPFFKGFVLLPEVRALYDKAVDHLAGNRLKDAVEQAQGAMRTLRGKLRSYATASVTGFERQLEEVQTWIDEDLYDHLVILLNDFKSSVSAMHQAKTVMEIDFESVSYKYWAVVDGIAEAQLKQDARDANSRMLVKAGKGSKKQRRRVEDLEREEARLADLERQREVRAAEEEKARVDLANEFAAAL